MGLRQGSGPGSLHGGKLRSAGNLSGGPCAQQGTQLWTAGWGGQPHRVYTLGRVKIQLWPRDRMSQELQSSR